MSLFLFYLRQENCCKMIEKPQKNVSYTKIKLCMILTHIIAIEVHAENKIKDSSDCFEYNVDYHGGDIISILSIVSAHDCRRLCKGYDGCQYFTWIKNRSKCYLKNNNGLTKMNVPHWEKFVSGPRNCDRNSYSVGWERMNMTTCGGQNIDTWIDGGDTGHATLNDFEKCELACWIHKECHCFMFRNSNNVCGFYQGGPLHPHTAAAIAEYTSFIKKSYWLDSVCTEGDVAISHDGAPYVFWNSRWSPICGHYFWDSKNGATLFCKELNYESGTITNGAYGISESGETYDVDAFRIGGCNDGDDWRNCKAGCNDYQLGGSCGNGDRNDIGNGNSGARCDANHVYKMSIECGGGSKRYNVSCEGAYECISRACSRDLKFKNIDWGYYFHDNEDCRLCKGYCMKDSECQSVECGKDYCIWWKNGKCDDAHELTHSMAGLGLTCLKDIIRNESFSYPRNHIPKAPPNVITKPKNITDAINDSTSSINAFLYAMFAAYIIMMVIFCSRAIKSRLNIGSNICFIVSGAIFKFLCYVLTGSMVLVLALRYCQNEDSSSLQYRTFNKETKDEYPTFSICFSSTPWHPLQQNFNGRLRKQYAIRSEEYNKLLKGIAVDRRLWKTKIEFSNVMLTNHDAFQFSIDPFLNKFGNSDAVSFKTKDPDRSTSSENYGKGNESQLFFKSYQDPDMVCFSRKSRYERGLIRMVDSVWLDLGYLVTSKLHLHVYIHHTGQLTRSLGQPHFEIHGSEVHISNSKINLRISDTSVLRKRTNAKVSCDESLYDDDNRFRKEVINQVGCVPIYWKSITPQDAMAKLCNTSRQMSDIFNYLQRKEQVMSLYEQPCNYMKVSVSVLQQQYFSGYVLLEVHYMDENYQDFKNSRDFGFESLWSGVGGFVGMFLGYSFLQIPNLSEHFYSWISIRLLTMKQST